MKDYLNAISNSYGEVFFISRPWVGVVFLALSFFNPNMALTGLVSVLASYLFARAIGLEKSFLGSGFFTYNPLLVGFAIGSVFQLGPLSLFFALIAAVVTFAVTIAVNHFFAYYLRLPILSLPFVITGSIVFLASRRYSGLFVGYLYPTAMPVFEMNLPFWVSGYFKSFGAILFMPHVVVGMVLAVTILIVSRILVFLSVLGYYSGSIITGLMTGSMVQSFSDYNHFNFILIAMAVGGVYLIPSRASYLMALLAVSVSTLFVDAVGLIWASFGVPAFPLPFVLVTLLFLYILTLLEYPLIPLYVKETPERTLDFHLTRKRRFPQFGPMIELPFSGTWQVWQGFDGSWTHQGIWAHAFDFVVTDSKGKNYKGSGDNLTDYYAFKKIVLSPVTGRVIVAEDSRPDCEIGAPEPPGNWGNHLIIKTEEGFFVEISHLMENSLKVAEGDWVLAGHVIGQCGNSGYSPQPHIHVQVQKEETLATPTLPFCLGNYRCEGKFFHQGRPQQGDLIEPTRKSSSLERSTAFSLDRIFRYQASNRGKSEVITWKVEMTPEGSSCLVSELGKLYFGKLQNCFFVYSVEGTDPYLKALYQALPRMPLVEDEQITFEDYLSLEAFFSQPLKGLLLFASSFFGPLAQVKGQYRFSGPKKINGEVVAGATKQKITTQVILDDQLGFSFIQAGNIQLELLESKSE